MARCAGLLIGVGALLVLGACGRSSDPGGGADAAQALDVPDAGEAASGGNGQIVAPTAQGWTFYGSDQGGPSQVLGATMDEGGNLWIAGGEEGLFLMKAGSTSFQKFGLADGLHPWGNPYPEQQPVTKPYLNVISVSGGPAGTVFVGYHGYETSEPWGDCEDNWYRADGVAPDPNIYKSGDADRVTLSGSGIQVTHYAISTPKGFVQYDPGRPREKLCTIYRILYDAHSKSVWFGGNHGYAWGDPSSSLQMEHGHPLLNGYVNDTTTVEYALTNYYWGLAVEPTGDLWVGGMFRSQHCPAGTGGAGFWTCVTEASQLQYQVDWWPDAVSHDSRPEQRVDDNVSGMSLGLDGSLWISSFTNGLAHRKADGSVEFMTTGLVDPKRESSVLVDPSDGSVWVGATSGGLTRIQSGTFSVWGAGVLGSRAGGAIPDLQVDTSGPRRRIIAAFRSGSVGIYDGP